MSTIPFQLADHAIVLDAMRDLHTAILKVPCREDMLTCGRHLGLLHKKTFVFNNEAETAILADYRIYSYRPRGFNTAELFLRLNRDRLDVFSQALLARMSAAQYSLFVIDSVEKNSTLWVSDLLLGSRSLLVDNGLSMSGRPGQAFAAHIAAFDDYSRQTGGMLPVDANLLNDKAVVRSIAAMMDGGVSKTDPVARSKMARAIISASIRLGFTENIAYQ